VQLRARDNFDMAAALLFRILKTHAPAIRATSSLPDSPHSQSLLRAIHDAKSHLDASWAALEDGLHRAICMTNLVRDRL
jgi:hypothetical protein